MSEDYTPFYKRHIGVTKSDIDTMLAVLGLSSMEELIAQALPEDILLKKPLDLPKAVNENEALHILKDVMSQNKCNKSFIGQGYYGTFVPPVILRNMLENPAWYTAYTPYQAEISQGRLEMLFYFQTMVTELTGLPIAAASLLDEGTALAEAQALAVRFFRDKRRKLLLIGELFPQSLDVLKTRAYTQNYQLSYELASLDEETAAIILPWPDQKGNFPDYRQEVAAAKEKGALVIVVADPLALTILEAPAKWGADIVVGSFQRFGTPMGFGGPHAGYLAAAEALTRLIPGRIVGQSIDSKGQTGYRLALQTREQHIRRDKATSNICTAQALLANMSTAYAIWHGAEGLKQIAYEIHRKARIFAQAAISAGIKLENERFFDCVTLILPAKAKLYQQKAYEKGYLVYTLDEDRLCINFDQLSTEEDVVAFGHLFGFNLAEVTKLFEDTLTHNKEVFSTTLPDCLRKTPLLTQPIFGSISSETEMMRFLRRLADKDLALDRAMIPLGSCTMKLNAASEMLPLSWDIVNSLHPFAPKQDTLGYCAMIRQLEQYLCEITGFSAISFQPNSGAQGEYAGLLAIRRFHEANGQPERTICLIPQSAHGTNPASAHIAGMRVVVVNCRENGDVDVEDLQQKAQHHSKELAALMITYPSTHGVYESSIRQICDIIHQHGGQVYFDGANLNALVGLARPRDIGADLCHLNLHKTFAIPHGGGGPGVGPIGVAAHLKPFLPGHFYQTDQKDNQNDTLSYAVASAPFSSASILTISWMYIRLMGAEGLKKATETAILNANYMAAQLSHVYPILYRGINQRVAHEFIVDTRILKEHYGITVDDIAKRLIDYGFHAPTMSFPVAGTLMIEPTESEPKEEIDRLCRALILIAEEAKKVGEAVWPKEDNPLINAPHTLEEVLTANWSHAYSREEAALPDKSQDPAHKYWPPVSRIDNVAGDRNLICSCPALSNYR